MVRTILAEMSQTVRPAGDGARPLRLAPFRALRYNPARVRDLGAVTCPPYDVIGPDRVSAWEAADPHNVVRLILPRNDDNQDRYAHATRDLRRWLATGLLVRDPTAQLYVYEHVVGGDTAIGLVGAVSLHDPSERRILPHEDVFPGPVADRAALMSATAAQLEPIMLTYEGDGPASDIVDAVIKTRPELEAPTPDGALHRMWPIGDHQALRVVAADLAERQALIADGHHRYAAYLELRDRAAAAPSTRPVRPGANQPDPGGPQRAAGVGPAQPASEYGLAMLVDAARHPLRLGPVHRSVARLPWLEALATARRGFRSVRLLEVTDAGRVLHELAGVRRSAPGPVFALADGQSAALISDPDPEMLRTGMPAGRSELWRSLDASVAGELVLAQLWRVNDRDHRVSYHHQADDAIARAGSTTGTALLLHPPRHADVLALAVAGERMPRKSTSFGPKPRTGLLMRLLDD